jgi:2'-5' RNA ligase
MSEGTAKDRAGSGPLPIRGSSTLRSFVAVPLPAPVRAAILAAVHDGKSDRLPAATSGLVARLADADSGLAAQLPDIRWSRRPENLHVTLKFLGQVDPAKLARFVEELAAALRAIPGFDIRLRGFGAFPSPRDAQVIWVGVDDPAHRLGQVAAITEQVAARTAVAGDPLLGKRPFRAHVTVGRLPRRARRSVDAAAALAPVAEQAFGGVTVSEVHVYESITGGEASTYVLRGTATLEGATHGDGKDRDQGRN